MFFNRINEPRASPESQSPSKSTCNAIPEVESSSNSDPSEPSTQYTMHALDFGALHIKINPRTGHRKRYKSDGVPLVVSTVVPGAIPPVVPPVVPLNAPVVVSPNVPVVSPDVVGARVLVPPVLSSEHENEGEYYFGVSSASNTNNPKFWVSL